MRGLQILAYKRGKTDRRPHVSSPLTHNVRARAAKGRNKERKKKLVTRESPKAGARCFHYFVPPWEKHDSARLYNQPKYKMARSPPH